MKKLIKLRKINYILILAVTLLIFNVNAFAASGSLSVSAGSVYVGDSFTATVNVNSAAAWSVHVSASGPVSGCTINQADATADAMDTSKTFSTTCTATGTGTITVVLSGDATSASNGVAVNLSGSRSVSVSQRPAPAPSNNGGGDNVPVPSTNNSGSNNASGSSRPSNNENDSRSKNNNLKELSIEGHELTKVDDNNYTASVSNDITSIKINATAEDSKSQISGAGNHDLDVGENNIEIIITAENGSQNIVNVKVTRKDGYYLEDLASVLNSSDTDDININIKSDAKLTTQDLEKIKSSGKTVKFNYYNEDKNLIYSWIIDGSKLGDINELNTTIIKDSDNKKDILRLSNYADGLFIKLEQKENLPAGAKIKLFVGEKYEDGDLVNVYGYVKDSDKLGLVASQLEVKNGYIEFDVVEAPDYLITMSNVPNLDELGQNDCGSSTVIIIVSLLCVLIAIGVTAFVIKNNKKGKKGPTKNPEPQTDTPANPATTRVLDDEPKSTS